MKVIILEGIATSGKTTVINLIKESLERRKLSCQVIAEEETLMPIVDNVDPQVSIKHLSKILTHVFSLDKEILIFDRLYFTHIFRTNSTVQMFKPIEDMLSQHHAYLFFLKIRKEKIEERIFNALKGERSGTNWVNYVRSKGNDRQIVNYYQNQQDKLLALLKESEINHQVIEVTNMEFEFVREKILQTLGL